MSFRLVIAFSALLGAGSLAAQTPASAPNPAPAPEVATPAAAPAAQAPLKPGDATAGQAKTAACAACHGMDGNSAAAQHNCGPSTYGLVGSVTVASMGRPNTAPGWCAR